MQREYLLDAHRDLISHWYLEYPALKTVQVYRRLFDRGVAVDYATVARYTREFRKKPKERVYWPLEFLPGEEGQVDWFFVTHPKLGKLCGFALILSYSRYLFAHLFWRHSFEFFIEGHLMALAFFMGCPHALCYDNLKSVVITRQPLVYNSAFLDFARHFGFEIRLCNVAAGNEKGRVEDGVRYIRHNFWPGRSFANLDDLNAQARGWRDQFANRRTHATTRKVPELSFDEDQRVLLPVQGEFDTDEVKSPKVSYLFRVDFDGNEYSVPWRLSNRIITLRANETCVRIFVGTKRVAAHPHSWHKGLSILRKEHEDGLIDQKPGARPHADLQAIVCLGPYAARYVKLIPAQTGSIRSELSRLMILITVYGSGAVEKAMGDALSGGFVGAAHLERMLIRDESAAAIKNPAHLSLADQRLILPPAAPDLKSYDAILMQPESDKEEAEDADPDRKPQSD